MQNSFIHSLSVIEDGARIGNGCYIGPFCSVGKDVVLCDNVRLISHVVISGDTKIGKGSIIYPFTSLGMAPQDLKFKKEKARLEIGENTIIRENVTASIGTEGGGMLTKIGNDSLIMAYCHVAHDCVVGNNVILVNGVNLSGHVVIEDFAIVGGMSAVKQFTRIGAHAMIGGFTGVDRDVIPYGLVRSERTTTIKGLNIIGLRRSGFPIDVIKEMLDAFKEIFVGSENGTVLSERALEIREKYKNNEYISQIVDFISGGSKNPICTTIPVDTD